MRTRLLLASKTTRITFNLAGLLLSAGFLLLMPSASGQCIAPPAGLVGWWQGEGDSTDTMGTNNGYTSGDVTFAPGKVGEAFDFSPNGGNGSIIVPDAPALELTNEITIEAWIKPRDTNSTYSIVTKLGTSGGENGYAFFIQQDVLYAQMNGAGEPWPSEQVTVELPIPTNEWCHVAWTYDQSAMVLYFNGLPVATNAVGPVDIATSANNLRIGNDDDTSSPFNGLIDEASLYNRALSAAEIGAIYAAGASGKCAPTTAPVIVDQTQSQNVHRTAPILLTAAVTGAHPLRSQWWFKGSAITNATNLFFNIPDMESRNAGTYYLAVTNSQGFTISSNIVLTLMPSVTYYADAGNANPVPPYTNWATAATNIQDAINLTSAGDVVLVTNGVYQYGGIVVPTVGGIPNRVALTQPITVRSINGPAVTQIVGNQDAGDPDNNIRCAYLTNRAALIGFTLTNGGSGFFHSHGPPPAGNYGGAALGEYDYLDQDHSMNGVLSNCVVLNSVCYALGGGSHRLNLYHCTLSGNSSFEGGGASEGILQDCTISSNSVNSGTAVGGGAHNCILTNCLLIGNSTFVEGFGFNGTSAGGGADSCTLYNCQLIGNFAQFDNVTSGLDGGGGASESTLYNCLLLNNYTDGSGGGALYDTLINCSVISNTAATSEGGVSQTMATSSIIYFNSAPMNPEADDTEIDYSCLSVLPLNGTGDITNDPAFVDPASGNFRLLSSSACIDTGSHTGSAGATDLDGNPRVVGGVIDMGAYEYQADLGAFAAWLQSYGFPTDGSADGLDPDGDGMSNWQEWRAGTDPTDASSSLQVLSITNSGSGPVITWRSVAGKTYYVQSATDLGARQFSTIQDNIPGQAGTTSYTDTNGFSQGTLYYRIGVQ